MNYIHIKNLQPNSQFRVNNKGKVQLMLDLDQSGDNDDDDNNSQSSEPSYPLCPQVKKMMTK